jgi:hypothetical protein
MPLFCGEKSAGGRFAGSYKTRLPSRRCGAVSFLPAHRPVVFQVVPIFVVAPFSCEASNLGCFNPLFNRHVFFHVSSLPRSDFDRHWIALALNSAKVVIVFIIIILQTFDVSRVDDSRLFRWALVSLFAKHIFTLPSVYN